jgi:hypothetical protein
MLDGIAERFVEFCEKPDPHPELAAAVRRELRLAEARAQRPSGEELAKRAIETGKAEDRDQRSGLGAQDDPKQPPMAFKMLNAPSPEADKLVADNPPPEPAARNSLDSTRAEAAARDYRPRSRPPTNQQPRNSNSRWRLRAVPLSRSSRRLRHRQRWPARSAGTASYGGQKALIIRSVMIAQQTHRFGAGFCAEIRPAQKPLVVNI